MKALDPVQRYLLLEGIFLKHGYDFRQYSEASLNRRLNSILIHFGCDGLMDLLKRCLESDQFFSEVLPYFTIGTTEFFRDPSLFLSLRRDVFPVLKTYPSIKIWVAGCSTGEEVVSLAVCLKEEGLLENSTIYATDINRTVLKKAQAGIYDLQTIHNFSKNYAAAGGIKAPSDYYSSDYGLVRMDSSLYKNVLFTEHNLVTDAVFTEAHLILCRNVMIYFQRDLQDRVYRLFTNSLVHNGFLAIGDKESARFSKWSSCFVPIDGKESIYQFVAFQVEGTRRLETL
jgi:chemotaxis protein methyltransferase CheR